MTQTENKSATSLYLVALMILAGVAAAFLFWSRYRQTQTTGLIEKWRIAVPYGDLETIRQLAGSVPPDDRRNDGFQTALMAACAVKDHRLAHQLLDRGADPNARTSSGYGPVSSAVGAGDIPMLRLLMEHGGRLESDSRPNNSLLRIASVNVDLEMIRFLLDNKMDPNEVDGSGQSPLRAALIMAKSNERARRDTSGPKRAAAMLQNAGAKIGLGEAVLLNDGPKVAALLKSGADPRSKDVLGASILAESIVAGKPVATRLLLEKGAGRLADGTIDFAALMAAIRQSDLFALKALMNTPGGVKVSGPAHVQAAGAAIHNLKDREVAFTYLDRIRLDERLGAIALGIAVAARDRKDVIIHLLGKGVPAKAKNDAGVPVVVSAGEVGDLSIVRLLVERGANVNARSARTGMTPLLCALTRKDVKLARWLLERGANPNASDNIGVSALMRAASNGDSDLTRELIKRGALTNARDQSGKTAKDRALQRNHPEIAALLP